MRYRLVVCIVPHDGGGTILRAARDAGAGGGTLVTGRGTASSTILQMLGLGETKRDITYHVVPLTVEKGVKDAIVHAASEEKAHFGIMLSMDATGFFRSGSDAAQIEEIEMKEDSAYRMINVIVSKGYADEAMAAARKAGAKGGTILGAHGTAKESDAEFFGVKLVPEKEMLLILVEKDRSNAVFQAISSLPCFAEKGSGVGFSLPVSDFIQLGKQ